MRRAEKVRTPPVPAGAVHPTERWFEWRAGQSFDPRTVATACIESGARALLLDADALPPEFFDLSSGTAGELLHRLSMYGISLAGVVADPTQHSAAFQDFLREANHGRQFRFFPSRGEAIAWLGR